MGSLILSLAGPHFSGCDVVGRQYHWMDSSYRRGAVANQKDRSGGKRLREFFGSQYHSYAQSKAKVILIFTSLVQS